jgi:hypothetical protein
MLFAWWPGPKTICKHVSLLKGLTISIIFKHLFSDFVQFLVMVPTFQQKKIGQNWGKLARRA